MGNGSISVRPRTWHPCSLRSWPGRYGLRPTQEGELTSQPPTTKPPRISVRGGFFRSRFRLTVRTANRFGSAWNLSLDSNVCPDTGTMPPQDEVGPSGAGVRIRGRDPLPLRRQGANRGLQWRSPGQAPAIRPAVECSGYALSSRPPPSSGEVQLNGVI